METRGWGLEMTEYFLILHGAETGAREVFLITTSTLLLIYEKEPLGTAWKKVSGTRNVPPPQSWGKETILPSFLTASFQQLLFFLTNVMLFSLVDRTEIDNNKIMECEMVTESKRTSCP